MKARKFKIGDKVLYTNDLNTFGNGIVKGYGEDGLIAVEFEGYVSAFHSCDGLCKMGQGYWCSEWNLDFAEEPEEEPVDNTKFKVGDRVEFLYHPEYGIGTVKKVDKEDATFAIEFDDSNPRFHNCGGICKNNQGYWLFEDTMVKVEELTIEKPTFEFEPVEPTTTHDPVNHPDHYTAGGIETIDFIQAKLTSEGFEGYLTGNILKYMTRYNHKNGLEDLKKASFYLNKLITVKEGASDVQEI